MNAVIYIFMLLFDFSVLAGAIWLIDQRGWSVWTILVAIIIGMGSNPSGFTKKSSQSKSGDEK